MEEVLAGTSGEVVIKIFGPDLDVLDRTAQDVSRIVGGISGVADVQVEAQPGVPELLVRLRPERLLQFGFRPVAVLEDIQAAYQGAEVGQVYEANRVVSVAVILDPAQRANPEAIGNLILHNVEGAAVPLG